MHLLGPWKFLLFKKSSVGTSSKVAAQAKKQAFGGAFDLQIAAEGKPGHKDRSYTALQKLLILNDPLES